MMNTTKKRQIPQFRSIQEEAEFWDTHSFADYWNDLAPAQIQFIKPLSHGLTVRLDSQTLRDLQRVASKKGIGTTTLIRMWVLERLDRSRNGVAA